MASHLPQTTTEFEERIAAVYDNGAEWLVRLPALVDEYSRRWSLTILPSFPLSYNYVTPALLPDGREVVLKLGPPNDELTSEMIALRLWDGRGAVRLLHAEPENGVMLMERVRPGCTILDVFDTGRDDETATRIACQVMRQIWQPPPADASRLVTVERWGRGLIELYNGYDNWSKFFSRRLVEMAVHHHAELQVSADAPVVLHGDLHHQNIIQVEDGRWLAIDPKGVVGERAYEVGAWLRNPLPEFVEKYDFRSITARRIDIFAEEFGLARERLMGWGLAQAVLSAWWDVEDGNAGPWIRGTLAIAEVLADMLG